MVTNPETAPSFSSWQAARSQGKAQFEQGNYEGALESFRAAVLLLPAGNVLDKQLLLSNMVACRLQMGGAAQARAAVADAQQCIALNPAWSKGHVRLASCYSVLGQSNDACNSLQTALRHDPGNRVARQMLVQELGRDRAARNTSNSNLDEANSAPPARNPDYQPEEEEEAAAETAGPPRNEPYPRAHDPQQPQDQPYPRQQQRPRDIDDNITLQERLQFRFQSAKLWYDNLSDDARTALHVAVGLLLLYVAFGGRFGFENSHYKMKGNYGNDNVYNQYRHGSNRETYYSSSNRGGGGGDNYEYANSWGYSAGPDAYSNSNNGNDAFLLYIGLTVAAAYAAHWMGISPWQMMLLLNMARGGRRRRFGGGGMMYGGGGGFGRPRRMRYGPRW